MQEDSCRVVFVSGHELQLGKKLVLATVSRQGTTLKACPERSRRVPASLQRLSSREGFSPRGICFSDSLGSHFRRCVPRLTSGMPYVESFLSMGSEKSESRRAGRKHDSPGWSGPPVRPSVGRIGEAEPWVGCPYKSRVGFNRRHCFREGMSPSAAKQPYPRGLLALILALGFISAATAQTGAKPTAKAAAWKEYCHPDYGFCFKYPSSWASLGPIFDGNGIVVAPPQKQDRALWDEVTVALMIPPPEGDEEPMTVDQAIEKAVSSVRESGQNFDTVQRQQHTVDGNP